ncbi:MAG: peptidylprolyl isomerase [Isosphaeraceae bacterium]
MRQFARAGLALALVASAAAPAMAQQGKAQNPATKGQPAAKGAANPAAQPAPAPFKDEVLATVNGKPIKKSEIIGFLSQIPIQPGQEQQAYQMAVTLLVNTELLTQFLKTQKLAIPEKEIDDQLAKINKEIGEAQPGSSLASMLKETNTTEAEYRDRIRNAFLWKKYVDSKADESELKKFFAANKDSFDKTRVRASHILLLLPDDADAAKKQAIKAKLVAIKKEITDGKISFKDAANKYSEDPGNKETKAGGDLDYFVRKGMFVEPFAEAAFAMKVKEISEPVETEYGWHLIQVTDRQAGPEPKYEEIKDLIRQQYATDLQNQIVAEARKTAKIETKDMPKDLFPPPPASSPTGELPARPAPTPAKSATPTKGAAPAGKAAGTPRN